MPIVPAAVAVPNFFEFVERVGLFAVEFAQESFVRRRAIISASLVNFQGAAENFFAAGDHVDQVANLRRRHVACADVNVHSASFVDACARVSQFANNLLQRLNVAPVQNRRDQFATLCRVGGANARIAHDRPDASVVGFDGEFAVSSARVACPRPEKICDRFGCLLPRDAREFNLRADLMLDGLE